MFHVEHLPQRQPPPAERPDVQVAAGNPDVVAIADIREPRRVPSLHAGDSPPSPSTTAASGPGGDPRGGAGPGPPPGGRPPPPLPATGEPGVQRLPQRGVVRDLGLAGR